MNPVTTYAILENGQPMDGEFYSFDRLMKALPYADYDARILAFDLGELAADLATPMRDVTEDMTVTWWDKHGGCNETAAWIEAGKSAPGLAEKYYSDQCARYSAIVEAA